MVDGRPPRSWRPCCSLAASLRSLAASLRSPRYGEVLPPAVPGAPGGLGGPKSGAAGGVALKTHFTGVPRSGALSGLTDGPDGPDGPWRHR